MMSGRRVAVLVALAAVAMAGAASSVGVIEIDEAGALHVNSSDPLAQPVLLNGQDVLSLVAAQASMIAEQESAGKDVESTLSELQQQNADQSRVVAALKRDICTLEQRVPELTSIADAGSGDFKWAGSVLAPNGLIYGVPYSAESVLIVDPTTNALDTTTIIGLPSTGGKWSGGVLAPSNNIIYCFPQGHDSVLKIDPTANTADWNAVTGVGISSHKFRSGALANNGLVYGIPYFATFVLIIDPNTDTIDTTTLGGLSAASSTSGLVVLQR